MGGECVAPHVGDVAPTYAPPDGFPPHTPDGFPCARNITPCTP